MRVQVKAKSKFLEKWLLTNPVNCRRPSHSSLTLGKQHPLHCETSVIFIHDHG